MTTELNETEIQQDTEHDPEYDAYVAFEVKGFAKELSELYVALRKLDENMAGMLSVIRWNPKFQDKLFRDFKHEDYPRWNSKEVISDISRSYSLTRTLNGTLAGFLALAKEYQPSTE